jgi:hypothetical protein
MDIVLHLNAHVRACAAGDWAIFLNIKRNRYQAAPLTRLADPQGRALRAGAAIKTFRTDEALAAQLSALDLVCLDPLAKDDRSAIAGAIERAGIAKPRMHRERFRLIDITYALAWARRSVREGSLERMFAELNASRQRRQLMPPEQTVDTVWQYYQSRRIWFPAAYVCLFDSLAFAMFAIRRGVESQIVFGVRARPFAAHSWVEHSGRVINDAAEYCASYTPILRA